MRLKALSRLICHPAAIILLDGSFETVRRNLLRLILEYLVFIEERGTADEDQLDRFGTNVS